MKKILLLLTIAFGLFLIASSCSKEADLDGGITNDISLIKAEPAEWRKTMEAARAGEPAQEMTSVLSQADLIGVWSWRPYPFIDFQVDAVGDWIQMGRFGQPVGGGATGTMTLDVGTQTVTVTGVTPSPVDFEVYSTYPNLTLKSTKAGTAIFLFKH